MHQFLYLSQDDIKTRDAVCFENAVETMRQVFLCHYQGDYVLPHKTVLRWGDVNTENERGRINAMPAYIGGPFQSLGLKWIGSFPANRERNLPRASALLLLNDPHTGLPLCIMEGAYVSAIRTAATNLLAARYLCAPDAHTLGIVGAGVQIRFHVRGFLEMFPHIREVRLFNRTASHTATIARIIRRFPVELRVVESVEAAIGDADIVIASTTTNAPFIPPDVMKQGVTYFHFSGHECEYGVVDACDKIFVDDWEVILHRNNLTPALMYYDGRLNATRITGNLGELVQGKIVGRTGNENIMFCAMGMAIEDVALGKQIHLEACRQHVGARLPLWYEPDEVFAS